MNTAKNIAVLEKERLANAPFCRLHRCTFLELRFTTEYETYQGCPECEKEELLRR